MADTQPQLILPVGTRIVTRSEVRADTERPHRPVGSVAEIIGVPVDALHSYRVRFADGSEASLRRKDFSILSTYKADETGAAGNVEQKLNPYVIYRCVVGSRASTSALPESPAAGPALHDLLVRLRLGDATG